MIALVSLVLFVALSLLGIKFSLIISVFSGVAEIVPIIGLIIAASVAALISVLSWGSQNFAISPIEPGIAVIIIYFIVRQIQDYFVSPIIMARITKLHPLIILFAVLAGQHSFGILGLILAVPIAAIIKLIIDFSFDKVNETNKNLQKK